jgi:DNA-binding Lrp family transcriptional regulator
MLAAYVLVQLGEGATTHTPEELRTIEGVKQAHLVLGPVDCIAFIEVADMDALVACVMAMRAVKGVQITDTRLAVL